MQTLIGIDLGTTNTVSAVDGKCVAADDKARGPLLPSVVAYLPNGKMQVGWEARRRLAIDPKNTIVSSKRIIARLADSSIAKQYHSKYPYDIVEGQDGLACFNIRSERVSPTTIAASIVASSTRLSKSAQGEAKAIVTVPTTFREPQHRATLQAAKLAGIGEMESVLEPVATAHAYLHGQRSRVGTFAVYDLGGGTFDLAIVAGSKDSINVIAYGGDAYLGGDDIDQELASWVHTEVLQRERWDIKTSAGAYFRLVRACEEAKIRLHQATETEINLKQVDPSAPFNNETVVLSAAKLSEIATTLVSRSFVICDEVLHRAGIKARDVDDVFLAGGSTQLDLVRDGVKAYFGMDPCRDYNPMEVVAIGSSRIANKRWG